MLNIFQSKKEFYRWKQQTGAYYCAREDQHYKNFLIATYHIKEIGLVFALIGGENHYVFADIHEAYDYLNTIKETEMEHKKTICIDFDGVIHLYSSGWHGAHIIPDPPVNGAIEGLYRLCADEEIDVVIFSARSGQAGGIDAMKEWLQGWDWQYRDKNNIGKDVPDLLNQVRFPETKPPAMCYIDDRGVHFDGDWSKITTDLKNFQPWNREK